MNTQQATKEILHGTPQDFLARMLDKNIQRAFLVYLDGEYTLSHPEFLLPIRDFLQNSQDFAQHEAIFIGREDGLDTLLFAFIHNTRRGLAQGGLRFWKYETMQKLLEDGLRLAQGMTRKNALAGLWWGGGKGIIPLPSPYQKPWELIDPIQRQKYFEAYGRFVASLHGVYYTAEDVGTNTEDMATILSKNRFVTCIPPQSGGSGNPSPFTARGVFLAIQASWGFLTGSESLKGVRIAVQGAGNVGKPLIHMLYKAGAEVIVSEVKDKLDEIHSLQQELPELQYLPDPDEIYDVEADIFAPCALGAVVNANTIPRLKVRLVCGAANNILEDERADSYRLLERSILFVPDFVCNRMGIMNCADEWMGYLESDVREATELVHPDTRKVLELAVEHNITPSQAANQLADKAAAELHPLMRHRGQRIVRYLLESGWAM